MKLHTVFVTHNRLELTKQAVLSYLDTIDLPHSFVVVDNASRDGTKRWIRNTFGGEHLIALPQNMYPGYACNVGWSQAPEDAMLLQRADNDFIFLGGWCSEVLLRFGDPRLGQLGMRTDEEEGYFSGNVGGNNIIRRVLFDNGLRYLEAPWTDRTTFPPGWSEDSFFSPAVVKMGYRWKRVRKPCIRSLASGDWKDPYYQRSYGDRGIAPHPDDPTLPGTT